MLSRDARNFLPHDVFGVDLSLADSDRNGVRNDEFALAAQCAINTGRNREMPVNLKILKQYRLIVGFQSGRVESEDASHSIQRLFNDPDFSWSMDRIYLIDDKSDMSDANLSGMQKFRDEVLRAYFGGREPDPSELPVYRIAVVCPQHGNASIMKLYGTVLDSEQTPIADLKLFDTIGDALAWLGQDAVSEAEIRQAIAAP